MARWNKICNEFKSVREAINNEDGAEILNGILAICEKYAKQKWNFAEDFDDLAYEIQDAIDCDITDDVEEVDYYLSEFYDLCDSARVWLTL